MVLPEELLRTYRRQRYQLAGTHSAVKTCHWTRESLRTGERRFCYKQKFYGIRTLRCLQMTPSLGRCLQRCLFCWRATPSDLGVDWDQTRFEEGEAEDPAYIVEQSIEAHRRAISGFKGNPRVDPRLVELAMNPVHAAVSLEGEPTLYPYIGDLIGEFFRHGFKTVFLVTNGLRPDVLADLSHEPSQLYVSVSAPDEETYKRVCRPLVPDGWRRLNETLELLESFEAPTVLRHTLVRGLNLKDPEGYARLIAKANPTYVEPKAAMAVGFYRMRLTYEDMPTHQEIRAFAEALARETGYHILDESEPSEIVLLSRLKRPRRFE
ncbi:4-demethylwyosine synthase TYW1 [Candidatus Bathyarchaeota archaeon]|nr:4-demethylwyosine synthase TYW1 [Candidatus Bathyarchaeota archaeon]RJS89889.1 MAG: 4-demethylwyosine synthase TYW1 [Candidatus Bathyarchaeota archaeon]